MAVKTAQQSSESIKQFSGRRYINIESYKKNGDPRRTPVASLEDNGLLYVWTDSRSWKVKRIRNNPRVRIVPSDRNGNPTGTWVWAEAEALHGAERDRVIELFKKDYGPVGSRIARFIARLRGMRLNTAIKIKPQT